MLRFCRCLLLITLVVVFPAAAHAGTRATAVLLPTNFAAADAPGLKAGLVQVFAAQTPGSTITVIDAPSQTTVARITLPDMGRYANPVIRARYQAPALQAVLAYIDKIAAARPAPGELPAQVALPVIVSSLSNFLPTADDRAVIVFGSARYDDSRERSFSMRNAVPGDGLIAASDDRSPYGTANRKGLLAGVSVSFCTTERPNEWASPMMEAKTERAWSLFIGGLGGKLVAFTPDLTGCVSGLLQGNATPPRHYDIDQSDKQLRMVTEGRAHAAIEAAPPHEVPAKATPAPGAGVTGLRLWAGRSLQATRSVPLATIRRIAGRKRLPTRCVIARAAPRAVYRTRPTVRLAARTLPDDGADLRPGSYSPVPLPPRRPSLYPTDLDQTKGIRSTVMPPVSRRVLSDAAGAHSGKKEPLSCS